MEPNIKNKVTPALFGIILICFFLPFFTVSCEGRTIKEFSGMNSVIGTKINGGLLTKTEKVAPSPFASLAFGTAVVGVAIGIMNIKGKTIISAALGILGFILLLLFRSNVITKVKEKLCEVEFNIGYFLCLILFLSVFVYNGYMLYQEKQDNKNLRI